MFSSNILLQTRIMALKSIITNLVFINLLGGKHEKINIFSPFALFVLITAEKNVDRLLLSFKLSDKLFEIRPTFNVMFFDHSYCFYHSNLIQKKKSTIFRVKNFVLKRSLLFKFSFFRPKLI